MSLRLSSFTVCAILVGATASLLFVYHTGSGLPVPAPSGVATTRHAGYPEPNVLPPVLLALTVVILTARALGALFGRLRQPPVIGEVIAGIVLGPSVFGRLAPAASAQVFQAMALPSLGVLAQLGVILFMFLVGMELDTEMVRRRTNVAVGIAFGSMLVAFTVGSFLALGLYPRLSTTEVPFPLFALFIGIALSVTAFPVLVRILTDRGMQKSDVGTLAISCAAIDDVTAWCLLAFVSSASQTRLDGAWPTIGLTGAYTAFVLVVVRPIVRQTVGRHERLGRPHQVSLGLMIAAMLASALTTEWLGMHAMFGAFLLGAVVPHDSRLTRELAAKLKDLVVALLLPAFFAFTGLRTQLNLVHGAGQWTLCLMITVVACFGKFGGTFLVSRVTGLGWRHSLAMGALMNTRGLMELIVLNVGLERGIISPTLFSMLVVMAVVTTLMTAPVLDLLGKWDEVAC
jgi:Kef-type K+ transport system membrane component KefB